ncbi:MAG: hypothetical protein JRI26_09410 [Deltaproteobacteria bacterium]|nr:hypothetical protein [Deltaproteobacteria bacterium]
MIFFDDDFDYEEAFYMGCIGGFIEQSNEEQDRSMKLIVEEDDTDDTDDREDLDT